jgi:hypothetical protein
MDSSDVIKALRDKTVYYNLQAKLSTQQSRTGAQPQQCGPNNSTSYVFQSFEQRDSYFAGRYDYAQDNTCATCSTCINFCYQ